MREAAALPRAQPSTAAQAAETTPMREAAALPRAQPSAAEQAAGINEAVAKESAAERAARWARNVATFVAERPGGKPRPTAGMMILMGFGFIVALGGMALAFCPAEGCCGPKEQRDSLAKSRDSETADEVKRLRRATALTCTIMLVELIGGYLANSLAILTDAVHLMSDVSGFLVSIFTLNLMQSKATPEYSFGYLQAGVIGGMISVIAVWVMAAGLCMKGVERLLVLETVEGPLMSGVAAFGLAANLLMMCVLGHTHSHDGDDHGHSHGGGGSGGNHGHSHGSKSKAESEVSKDHGHSHGGHGGSGPKAEVKSASEGSKGHGHSHGGSTGHGHSHGGAPGGSTGHGHSHGGGGGDMLTAIGGDNKGGGNQESIAMQAAMVHVIGDILQSIGAMLAGFLIWWMPFDVGYSSTGISHWEYADPMITLIFSVMVVLTTVNTVKRAGRQVLMSTPFGFELAGFKQRLMEVTNVVGVHDIHVWQLGSSLFCTAHVLVDDVLQTTAVLNACIDVAQNSFNIGHATFQLEVQGSFQHGSEFLKLDGLSCHSTYCGPNDGCGH